MKNKSFLLMLTAIAGIVTQILPLSWFQKVCTIIGVACLCAASLLVLERWFDGKLWDELK